MVVFSCIRGGMKPGDPHAPFRTLERGQGAASLLLQKAKGKARQKFGRGKALGREGGGQRHGRSRAPGLFRGTWDGVAEPQVQG